MPDINDLPRNDHLSTIIESITVTAEAEIRNYIQGRKSDVQRGAETPELAAMLIEKYAAGFAAALRIAGIKNNIIGIADQACQTIDPQFKEHRQARWAARPAALTYHQA